MSNIKPLYDSLNSECKINESKPLIAKQKKELIKNIEFLDENGRELLFVIIKIHHDLEENGSSETIYNCDTKNIDGKSDFEWCIDDIPNILQHMIYNFVKKHNLHSETVKNKQDLGSYNK